MKRNYRFLALFLALLFILAVPCALSEEAPVEREEVGTSQDYVDLLTEARTPYAPETVVFTDAGPFMPAVDVGGARIMRAARANAADADENGVKLQKTAKDNGDGSYTLTLEAYTTGEVTSVTKTTPVDFVLVLDQSGSMADDFENGVTRQQAMKTAVNNFISAVNEKYDAQNSDHRIALVTFGGDATISQHWTYVDEAGKTALQSVVSGLKDPYNAATNAGTAMQQAEKLMGSEYSYNGSNVDRQKVVIMFTDGVPTTGSDFDTSIANIAISSAKKMKDSGVTVYTIGIFQGADPSQLYGECNGKVGSSWSASKILIWGDVAKADIPAGNRFLNYVSSNFDNATEIGLRRSGFDVGFLKYTEWEITKNFSRSNTGYYLTAKDSASLNRIFQTITQNIQTADINLGSRTVVKDVVTPYFDLPADASSVKLYTAKAKADGTFEALVPAGAGVQAKIQGSTLEVNGFDFNDNYVTAKAKEDGTYGRKLVIEFTITPKADFVGGNQVPTNEWEQSGVYDEEGTEVKKFTDEESTPKVDVPIRGIAVSAQEKNVYLLGSLTSEELTEGAVLTLNGKPLAAELSAFVNVTVAPKTGTNLTSLTGDAAYQLTATLSPKEQGGAAALSVDSAMADVHVYKPELTYRDSAINLGDTADYAANYVGEAWKHEGQAAAESVHIYGEKPELTCAFNPAAGAFTQDTPVAVSVRIGDQDVTPYVSFIRKACDDENCDHRADEAVSGSDVSRVNFVVHVKDFDLTICVTGWESTDEHQSFLFTVTGSDGTALTVSVTENGSVTIAGLSAGKTYTVNEDTGWSWRYTPDSAAKTVRPEDVKGGQATLTFSHTRTNTQWLDGSAGKDNRWK